MFIDKVKIYLKAGNGGNGAVSFHREKYVSMGGPDGGDGGVGGSIYFVADPALNTLLKFRYAQHFKAIDGENGAKKDCSGKSGESMIISVPQGTIVKDADNGKIIADIFYQGKKVLILSGGKGGRGNARFATPTRQAPTFSEQGVKTEQHSVVLELKTIADVGLIGFPNVGKSTILSVISAARPKIADYHFTTLSPNLGMVKHFDESFVVADIPGLIEGAGEGAGLGHEFLRHIERVRLMVHVVDVSEREGRNPAEDYKTIRKELALYSEELIKRPELLVANKIDILESEELIGELEKEAGKKAIRISAATNKGVAEMVNEIAKALRELPPIIPVQKEAELEYEIDTTSICIKKDDDGAFVVLGGVINDISRRVIMNNQESFRYFQRMLRERGIIDALIAEGVKEGDIVRISDFEFEYLP